jgi:hypothetical protein
MELSRQAAVLVLLAATAGVGIVSPDLGVSVEGHTTATLPRRVVERQGHCGPTEMAADTEWLSLSKGALPCPDQHGSSKANSFLTTIACKRF